VAMAPHGSTASPPDSPAVVQPPSAGRFCRAAQLASEPSGCRLLASFALGLP